MTEREKPRENDTSGIVFDIRRGVTKDGPGLRTSVFLKGCPLRCAWCHNPESQSPEIERAVTTGEVCGRSMAVSEVMAEVRRDAVFYAQSGGGVTITGGEPLAQPAFSLAIAAAALREGIDVAIDTSGFAPWRVFEKLLAAQAEAAALRDLAREPGIMFLYDLKCIANLQRLDAAGARTWIRCPLVPGINDSPDDLAALEAFAAGLGNVEKTEICPYHPLGLEKYAKFGKTPPLDRRESPSPETVAGWKKALAGIPSLAK